MKKVVENLLHDLQIVNNKVDSLALVVNTYFEYKEDDKEFMDYMQKQWEKNSDKQRTDNKNTKGEWLGFIPQE